MAPTVVAADARLVPGTTVLNPSVMNAVPPGATVIVQQGQPAPVTSYVYTKYNKLHSKILGYIQIFVCGIGSIIAQSVALHYHFDIIPKYRNSSFGVCSGLLITNGFNVLHILFVGIWCALFVSCTLLHACMVGTMVLYVHVYVY